MRKIAGTIVCVGLVLAALLGYRSWRTAEAGEAARDRLLQAVAAIPGYAENRQTYLELIDGTHEAAFDSCYTYRRTGGRRRLTGILDADCYRQRVFQAMISRAQEAERADIALALDRARADETYWSSL